MEFSVRHWIPGRVRLHIPALVATTRTSGKIVRWLTAQDGILDVRINHACSSLIVSYDESQRALLETMLDYLQYMTPRELLALVAASEPEAVATPQPPATTAPPPTLGPSVLALPTVSLALAFSANPVVAAANVPLM